MKENKKKFKSIKVPPNFKTDIEKYAKEHGVETHNLLISATYEYMLKVGYLSQELPTHKAICQGVISGEFDEKYQHETQLRSIVRIENNVLQFFTKESGLYELLQKAKIALNKKKGV